ncbi:Fucose 4-O-acetylase [Lachnospiraceae bacterium]|nr:Fucose 4-O-acetylase [Lachnospiraceae bacterium]
MSEEKNIKSRVEWIDVAKAIGIFFIYLGHLAERAGLAYNWVFLFHVPLFFYLSGCLENRNDNVKINDLVLKKFINIIIPYFIFCFIVLAYEAVGKGDYSYIKNHLIIIIKGGIRNSFYLESGLWFLTCLFVLETLFAVLRRIIKYKYLILIICIGLNFLIRITLKEPSWYYNIDSALKYMVFYCIGWMSFENINAFLNSNDKRIIIVRYLFFVFAVLYSGAVYFKWNLFIIVFGNGRVSSLIDGIITSLVLIYLVIQISCIICKNSIIKKIGINSLYLCGCEYLVKSILGQIALMIGLNIVIDNTIQAMLYTGVVILIANYTMVPVLKEVIARIQVDIKELFL